MASKSTPKKSCNDLLCPHHGSLKVRGSKFTGTVVSDKAHKTVIVEWERRRFIKKYDRYEKRRTRVQAQNPTCIDAKEGDKVLIMETRPISKTKHFVVMKKIGVDEDYLLEMAEEEIASEAVEEKPEEKPAGPEAKEEAPKQPKKPEAKEEAPKQPKKSETKEEAPKQPKKPAAKKPAKKKTAKKKE